MPGGDLVSQGLDKPEAARSACGAVAKQRLRRLPGFSPAGRPSRRMKVASTRLREVLLIEPTVFGDSRGFFFESWNAKEFERAGIRANFVQDNHSRSAAGVLRGLHYQVRQPQGKLIRVLSGEIFDVAVDIRRSSPTFGKWEGARLSAESKNMLWV